MKKSILARHKFNKCTKRHDGFYNTFVNFAHFRNSDNVLDTSYGGIHHGLIISKYIYHPSIVSFLDDDIGSGCLLDFLDDLTTWPNDCANLVFVDINSVGAWRVWL